MSLKNLLPFKKSVSAWIPQSIVVMTSCSILLSLWFSMCYLQDEHFSISLENKKVCRWERHKMAGFEPRQPQSLLWELMKFLSILRYITVLVFHSWHFLFWWANKYSPSWGLSLLSAPSLKNRMIYKEYFAGFCECKYKWCSGHNQYWSISNGKMAHLCKSSLQWICLSFPQHADIS